MPISCHYFRDCKTPLVLTLESTHVSSLPLRALILFIQTLALYKSFTYLLTYLTGCINFQRFFSGPNLTWGNLGSHLGCTLYLYRLIMLLMSPGNSVTLRLDADYGRASATGHRPF